MSLDPNARRGRFRCTVEIFVAELGLPHGTEIEDIQFDKEQGVLTVTARHPTMEPAGTLDERHLPEYNVVVTRKTEYKRI